MTPFMAPVGYLSYGNVMHNMSRKMICDICKLPMIGRPVQKRHAECAMKVKSKEAHKFYVRRLVNAPVVAIGSKWKLKKEMFEVTELDGLYVKGLWHRVGKTAWTARISRARLHAAWVPLEGYGSLCDFTMGPLPQEPVAETTRRVAAALFKDCHELTDEQKKAVQEFDEERKRQLEADPPRGLRGPTMRSGWQCPNCGGAHAPDVATCPEPPRDGSLRERLKAARS